MTFNVYHFSSKVNAGIETSGYLSPTPIQKEAMPHILSGKDVMGLAQTGTGKTAAFVLPILQRLLSGPGRKMRALILAPTRELAEQTHNAILSLGRKTGLASMSIYGGVGIQQQIRRLKKGVDVVTACPGRLLDHINRGTIDLSNIEILVMDEADQMFDMGFFPDIRKIVKRLPADRQNLMFSATMPEDIKHLASEVLNDPVRIRIGHRVPVSTVSHSFYPVTTQSKNTLLLRLLTKSGTESVLVFTRTKRRSQILAEHLEKAGHEATALHGNLSQSRRQKALEGFRSGRYKILVATDVAARGIDVRGISRVINYDMPATAVAYTHRIGRTGRADETGDALTFVCGEDKGPLRAIQQMLGGKLKYVKIEGFARPETALNERPNRWPASPKKNYRPRRASGQGRHSTVFQVKR
ncbi:MAG: DEAD/DEAH box helicase [Desulfobacterales bacterium]